MPTPIMEQKKNYLSLILLDALEDENESDINLILDSNGNNIDPSYIPQDRGISPLHYVCGIDNDKLALEVARRFLDIGANPNCKTDDDITPMHVAAIYGKAEIVRLLLNYGANLEVNDNEGKSPIQYAFENCFFEIVKLLRDRIFLDKYEKKKNKKNLSFLSESKFEKSLQEKLSSNQSTPQHFQEKYNTVQFKSQEKHCINKNLLKVNATLNDSVKNNASHNSPDTDQGKFTPNRLNYNYDVTSPYYINITHRRHKPQPKFPDFVNPVQVGENKTILEDSKLNTCIGDDVLSVSMQKANILSSSEEEDHFSESVNIFSLTQENLKELTERTAKSKKSRASLIEVWRDKVQKSRPRTSEMKLQFNDVNELIDVVMENDHLNFNNTEIKRTKTTTTDTAAIDSGLRCGSASPSRIDNDTIFLDLPCNNEAEKTRNAKAPLNSIETEKQQQNIILEEKIDSIASVVPEISSKESPHENIVLDSSFGTAPQINIESVAENNELDASTNFIRSPKHNEYFMQMAEAYIHTDDENGLVFYETKLLSNIGNKIANLRKCSLKPHDLDASATTHSTNITIPLDYETDELRAELTIFGDPPGPITKTTKRLYVKKLMKYKRKTEAVEHFKATRKETECKFSVELRRTLKAEEHFLRIQDYMKYEARSMEFFANNRDKKRLREGHLKQSFIYMLIDPRISCNLAGESAFLDKFDVWQRFLYSIFYVGKGKTTRPYSHLYDAMKAHSRMHNKELHEKLNKSGKKISIKKQPLNVDIFKSPPQKSSNNKKLDRILDIWGDGYGVVCLHVFHNIVPIEAYTREAAIIDAMGVNHLTNCKRGDYYGPAKTWSMKEKKYLGIALLYKALQIYLAEGESQLSPGDLV